MTSPFKMPAIKRPGFFARVWLWLGRLLRRKSSQKLSDKTVDEKTATLFPPVVVSRRILPEENFRLPARPRLKPSMVPTTKFPVKEQEEAKQTTKVQTPPEPAFVLTKEQEAKLVSMSVAKKEALPFPKISTPPEPISLPMPVSIISPRGKARLLSILEGPTEATPMEIVSRDAATQQFHSPHLVSPTTGSKIVPPTLRNQANTIVPVRSVASSLSYEEAPKTLVQARVQDSQVMELVEEFNNEQGDSEP